MSDERNHQLEAQVAQLKAEVHGLSERLTQLESHQGNSRARALRIRLLLLAVLVALFLFVRFRGSMGL